MAKKATPKPQPPITKWEKNIQVIREGFEQLDFNKTDSGQLSPAARKLSAAQSAFERIANPKGVIATATWDGSENVVAKGTAVDILMVDFNSEVFIRSACWIRYVPEGKVHPKYLSCDLADLDLGRLDELDLHTRFEVNEVLVRALVIARGCIVDSGNEIKYQAELSNIDRGLRLYEESEM